jgi:hypothetical protein
MYHIQKSYLYFFINYFSNFKNLFINYYNNFKTFKLSINYHKQKSLL